MGGVVSRVEELHQEAEVPRGAASASHHPRAYLVSHPTRVGAVGILRTERGRTPVITRHPPSNRLSVLHVTLAGTCALSAPVPISAPFRPSENMSRLKKPKCGQLAGAGALLQLLQQEDEEPVEANHTLAVKFRRSVMILGLRTSTRILLKST